MLPTFDIGKLPPKIDDIDKMLFVEHEMIVNAIADLPKIVKFDIKTNSEKHLITIDGSFWDVGCKVGLSVCGWRNGFYKNCLVSPKNSSFQITFTSVENGFYDVLVIKDDLIQRREAIHLGNIPHMKITKVSHASVDIEVEKAEEKDFMVVSQDKKNIFSKRILVGTKLFRINLPKDIIDNIFVFKYYKNITTHIDKDTPYVAIETINL